MGEQLSLKAAIPLAEILATFRKNVSNTGPSNVKCISMSWHHSETNFHDDIIKWKHFPRYWPFVRGIHRSPVNSPNKGQWRRALMPSLICPRINGRVYNDEADDLRRHRARCDVIVMFLSALTYHRLITHVSYRCVSHSKLQCHSHLKDLTLWMHNDVLRHWDPNKIADDIYNEKFYILIQISLKFVPDSPVDKSALSAPEPWFNIKMSSYQYRKSHCGDKMVIRPSYLHNGISFTGKMASLYWISPLIILHIQCHGCWWLDDSQNQGISDHGIYLILLKYSNLSTARIEPVPQQMQIDVNISHISSKTFKHFNWNTRHQCHGRPQKCKYAKMTPSIVPLCQLWDMNIITECSGESCLCLQILSLCDTYMSVN